MADRVARGLVQSLRFDRAVGCRGLLSGGHSTRRDRRLDALLQQIDDWPDDCEGTLKSRVRHEGASEGENAEEYAGADLEGRGATARGELRSAHLRSRAASEDESKAAEEGSSNRFEVLPEVWERLVGEVRHEDASGRIEDTAHDNNGREVGEMECVDVAENAPDSEPSANYY